jgi:hypothetical protein
VKGTHKVARAPSIRKRDVKAAVEAMKAAGDVFGLAGCKHADKNGGDAIGSIGWLEAVTVLAPA